MSYPRMSKEEYGEIPKLITSDKEYNTMLEFIVMAAIKIDEVKSKLAFPLIKQQEKEKLNKQIELMLIRYDQLCKILDDYKEKGNNNE